MRANQITLSLTRTPPLIEPENFSQVLADKGVFPIHLGARFGPGLRMPKVRPSFVYGPPGVGKTYLAVAYLASFLMEYPGASAGFKRTYDLLSELRAAIRNRSAGGAADRYGSFRFLVLDDLGAERDTALVQESFFALIDYRSGHNLPTLATSNYSLDRIAEHYGDFGDRIASRIAGMGPSLELKGKDRRWQS